MVADRDVNAATNLVLVLLEYLLHDKRPEHLDAPYAGKYQRACDPADWSAYAVGVPVSAEPPAASGDDGDGHGDNGDDEGYEDDATAAAAVGMDVVGGGSMWTRGAGASKSMRDGGSSEASAIEKRSEQSRCSPSAAAICAAACPPGARDRLISSFVVMPFEMRYM